MSETTPRFVTFCECLSLRSRVALGAGMVLCRLLRLLCYCCKSVYPQRRGCAAVLITFVNATMSQLQ